MTLGGLAIAIGELVDDAVVGVENILRRLRENRALPQPAPGARGDRRAPARRCAPASSTRPLIIVLVFVPLFALSGIEGRLFAPLGIAYIVSILAIAGDLDHRDAGALPTTCCRGSGRGHERRQLRGARISSAATTRCCDWAFAHQRPSMFASVASRWSSPASARVLLPRAFLPPFNEGTLLVIDAVQSRHLARGIASARLHRRAPHRAGAGGAARSAAAPAAPSSTSMPKACTSARSMSISTRSEPQQGRGLSPTSARGSRCCRLSINIGQPIAHRLDHMLSGVRAQIALKIYRRRPRHAAAARRDSCASALAGVAGLVDLQVEKQVLIPQVRIARRLRARGALRRDAGRGRARRSKRCRTAAGCRRSSKATGASTW